MKRFIKRLVCIGIMVIVTCSFCVPVMAWERTDTDTKKGLQGADASPIYSDLGVNHTLYNINITDLISVDSGQGNLYVYDGGEYYFNYPHLSPSMVTELNNQGVAVTVVLLMPWDDSMQDLIYEGARTPGFTYYALNTYDEAPKKKLEALFHFLAENYCREDCHIDNWILGNEVNMPAQYHYTGTTDLAVNVEVYANSYALLYEALREYSLSPRAYISLDHSWNDDNGGRGIKARDYLDRFNLVINQKIPDCEWHLAFHAYAPVMTDSRIWLSTRFISKTYDSMFISGDNIEVLTEYVKNTFGENHRIILSEQGFTAGSYGETVQAAAIAYTYYKAEFNDMIDAVIFRSLYDEEHEVADGFYFGLMDGTKARLSYDVFKYMDTVDAQYYLAECLDVIGITSWSQLVPGYDADYFSENKTAASGTVSIGKYAAVFNPEYYLQNNPDIVAAYGYDYTAAIRHFQTNGMMEGRRGCLAFDPVYYRESNEDIAMLFGDEWWRYYEHYITHGIMEGRKGAAR